MHGPGLTFYDASLRLVTLRRQNRAGNGGRPGLPEAASEEWVANRRLGRRGPIPASCLEEPLAAKAVRHVVPRAFGVQGYSAPKGL